MKECVKRELWRADIPKTKGEYNEPLSENKKIQQKPEFQKQKKKRKEEKNHSERRLLQKSRPHNKSRGSDPDRNRCRRCSSSGSQCPTCFSSHCFMSSHLDDAFTCWINRSRRVIMFCTWLRRKNTSPISFRWAPTSGSSLDTASTPVDEVEDKPLTNEAALANLGGEV